MEFDRQIAQLQGALLIRTENLCQNVSNVFGLPNADKRKLFVFLLLNTDNLVDTSDLSNDQKRRFAPFTDFCPKIEISDFFAIVEKSRLWNLFFESLPFIPLNSRCFETDVILRHAFSATDILMSTSFVASLLRKMRRSPNSDTWSRIVDVNLDKLFQKLRGKSLGHQILSTLFLTSLSVSVDSNNVLVDSQKSNLNDLITYYGVTIPDQLKPIEVFVVEKLLSHYVCLAKSISIDVWIDLIDEGTRSLLAHPCINFW